ncbi:MAG: aspartate carbamoyltransferase [Clostridia bacterium]|nr:aspartate carbamoyltransferase [Clostridia bacterium]
MKHLIDIRDLSVEELDFLMDTAIDIKNNPEKYSEKCKGKKLATLFFEPSTRTRLSFEAAMYELGGNVLGFSEAASSSSSKGESVADTARIVGCYADIIAMRHPKEGAPLVASAKAGIPVINAGDGGHNHPTQTLADILTIRIKKGGFDNLTVGFCGDLKYGRTVHSLIAALSRYKNVKLVLISPEELRVPKYVIKDIINGNNMEYVETADLEEAIPSLDILYMTRIQRERFDSKDSYERLKDSYVLKRSKLENAKKDLCILHPLPRVNEISVDVDDDERACYFEQALNGKYMRMALILKLLEEESLNSTQSVNEDLIYTIKCKNPRCITSVEQELPHIFRLTDKANGICRCIYCESKEKNT